jgi:hypothetical protein
MGNDSWDWPGAFEAAGKHQAEHPEAMRLSRVLKPDEFARALRSMWTEHGMIERSDPRVQEIGRTGRLEWWDGRGRCVVLVREGAPVPGPAVDREGAHGITTNASSIAPIYLPIPDGTPEGVRVQEAQFDRAAAPLIKAAEERAIAAEQASIDQGVTEAAPREKTAEGLAAAINTSGVAVARSAGGGFVDVVLERKPADAPKPGKKKR